MKSERNNQIKILIIGLISLVIFIVSFAIGRYTVTIPDILKTFSNEIKLTNFAVDTTVRNVVINVRMPRILAAILVGAALSTSGAIFQSIFRNPMASPDLLGASSGAGFGAAAGILLYFSYYEITLMSFVFGLGAVGLTYLLSSISRMERTLSLVLAGIMISSIFNSLLSMLSSWQIPMIPCHPLLIG